MPVDKIMEFLSDTTPLPTVDGSDVFIRFAEDLKTLSFAEMAKATDTLLLSHVRDSFDEKGRRFVFNCLSLAANRLFESPNPDHRIQAIDVLKTAADGPLDGHSSYNLLADLFSKGSHEKLSPADRLKTLFFVAARSHTASLSYGMTSPLEQKVVAVVEAQIASRPATEQNRLWLTAQFIAPNGSLFKTTADRHLASHGPS